MPHLDEGLLMALLDGELTAAEQQESERHLQSCAECSARLQELKGFTQEADGLVADLGEPPALAPSPVVTAAERRVLRRVQPRTLAWAASIVAALGLGFAGSQLLTSDKMPSNYAAGVTQQADERSAAATPPAPAPTAASPQVTLRQERQPTEPGITRPAGPVDGRDHASDETGTLQGNDALAVRSNLGQAGAAGSVSERDNELADAAAARRDSPAPVANAEAAAKLAELPRREESQAAEQRMAPASPASGSGLRSRAQAAPVFLRVTMEEAVNHLSGAIRLIDGLTPEEFSVASPDSSHPVVRVLYRVGRSESRLFLEQRRADNSFVASDLQAQTMSVTPTSSGNMLSWNDLRGFALTLVGPFSPDSLFHFKTLVK